MRFLGSAPWLAPTVLFALAACGQADSGGSTPSTETTIEQASALEAAPPIETVVWENRLASGPSARWGLGLAYDSTRKVTVLFGGSGSGGKHHDDTWEWDGESWTERTPDQKPSQRDDVGLAFDSARGKVVLFGGGKSGNAPLNDTWEWDGESWTEMNPDHKPSARYAHAVAYDSARRKVVLFGGRASGSALLADTWEWDGQDWTEVKPEGSPIARHYHALAYDSARGKVVLFGGRNAGYSNDTWEWDGESWENVTPQAPAAIPPGRENGAFLAYDSLQKRTVLFGGNNVGRFVNDTWAWDGESWTKLSPTTSPAVRAYQALAYDSERRRVVLFGGGTGSLELFGDTWELHGFGGACSTNDECDTGFCVDGVCCQTACGGGDPNDCMACSVAAGAEKDGVCAPVANDTPCESGNACTTGDSCQSGACVFGTAITCAEPDACEEFVICDPTSGCVYETKPAGTICRASACEGGEENDEGLCDGESLACPDAITADCGPYACGASACLTSCASDDDCVGGTVCVGASCVIEEADAGADAGDELDGGDVDDAGVVDAGESGGEGESAGEDESGCSCRAAGGGASHGQAAWLGLGLAVAVWRRSRSSGSR